MFHDACLHAAFVDIPVIIAEDALISEEARRNWFGFYNTLRGLF
jgi:hypothetical protein